MNGARLWLKDEATENSISRFPFVIQFKPRKPELFLSKG
jgi:hypothetical protein